MRRSGGAINATSLRPKTAHPSNRQQAPPPPLSQYHSFQIAFADWAFNARQRPKIYANLPTFRLGTWAHNLLVIPAMAPTTNPLHPRTDHSVDASIRSKSPASPTREFSCRPYIPSSSYRRTILAKVWDTKYAAVFIESETSERSPSSPSLPGSLVSWAWGIHANLMYFIRHRHFLLPFEAARRAVVGDDVGLTFLRFTATRSPTPLVVVVVVVVWFRQVRSLYYSFIFRLHQRFG